MYQKWELFMILILICACFTTPYEIAFPNGNDGKIDESKIILDKLFDLLFLIDAILTFSCAVLTDDHNILDDRKEIASSYIRGWFTLDILSCLPYGDLGKAFLSRSQMHNLQLIKLIKLLRILKLVKEQRKLFHYMHKYL
jgi:hypothetical protein